MIVDTNTLSAWREAKPELLPVIGYSFNLVIPVIALGEYMHGLPLSREREQATEWLEKVLETIPVASVGVSTAKFYATLRTDLRRKGRPIPENDLWIAAIALERRLPILSRDHHFDAVEGVTRIGW